MRGFDYKPNAGNSRWIKEYWEPDHHTRSAVAAFQSEDRFSNLSELFAVFTRGAWGTDRLENLS